MTNVPFPYDGMASRGRPINVSQSCFLPASLFSLRLTAWLAKRAGFAGLEVLPFWGSVLGGVPSATAVPIVTAHGHFNPTWKKRFAAIIVDTILFPPRKLCEDFLLGLAIRGVPVNTYFIRDLERRDIYASYQPYPGAGIPFEEVIRHCREAGARITFDLAHIRDGHLFPDWRTCWETICHRVDNVHIQPLDVHVPESEELRKMWEEDQSAEIAEMLRFIGRSGYEGPITLEVDPRHMAKILGQKALLPQTQVWYLDRLRRFVEAQLCA
jgi:hypothetical protein